MRFVRVVSLVHTLITWFVTRLVVQRCCIEEGKRGRERVGVRVRERKLQ